MQEFRKEMMVSMVYNTIINIVELILTLTGLSLFW